jgi:carbon-monoxide dehydrogenase medium subunit
MHSFEYLEPATVADAARTLAEYGTRARVLAGGTDLLIQMQHGRHQPEAVVYLGRIPELQEITPDGAGGLRIGGAATLRQVENYPAVIEQYPALETGAREVGSVQIRNLGTLAGNAANASPSADTAPALLAYDAEVELIGANGASRTLPIAEFWTGPGQTALHPGEFITTIRLPTPPEGLRSSYRKLAVRKAMDLAMVGIGLAVVSQGDSVTHARIALGAVGPVCFRASDAEAALLAGGRAAIDEAARLAAAASTPIDDQRASAAYRRVMVQRLVTNGLTSLFR